MPLGLAIVLVCAASFRALYLITYARTSVLFDGTILDSALYDSWAQRIAGGAWKGPEAFYFAPLYPYSLGLLFRVMGHSYAAVYMIQGLMGLLCIVLVHATAARLFGRRAALFAAAGMALYLPLPFFETKIMGATLGLMLSLLALFLLVRAEDQVPEGARASGPSKASLFRRYTPAGFAIGAAALCTPATLLLALLQALSLFVRRRPTAAAGLLAGSALALLPTLAHNVVVSGEWMPISAQGGVTFYQGNHPGALGLYAPAPGFSGAPERQAEEQKQIAGRETGRSLGRSESSTHFFHKGLSFIAESPGRWFLLEVRKLGYLLGSYEPSTEYSQYQERERMPILWAAWLPFAVIIGAAFGALLSRPWRDDRHAAGGRTALLIYTIHAAAIPLLFFVSSRYRLPLASALLLWGGAFASELTAPGARRRGLIPRQVRGLLGGLALALISLLPLGRPRVSVEANVYYNLGGVLAERGRHVEAVREYERCLSSWPEHAFALVNRGNSLDRLGRPEDAMASYRRAQEVRPGFWKAYQAEGAVLFRQKRYEEAMEVYQRGSAAGGADALHEIGAAREALARMKRSGT